MTIKYIQDINFAIYDHGKIAEIIKPDYIGLIGIHVNNMNHIYPKNMALEIGMIGPNKVCQDEYRVPVVVSLSDTSELALRLKDFDADKVKQWSEILNEIYSI